MVEHLPQDPDQEHLSVSKLGVDNWTCPVALRPWWAVFVTQRRTWAALLQFYRWHYGLEKYFDKCLSAKNNMDLGLDIADDLAKVDFSQNHLWELFLRDNYIFSWRKTWTSWKSLGWTWIWASSRWTGLRTTKRFWIQLNCILWFHIQPIENPFQVKAFFIYESSV